MSVGEVLVLGGAGFIGSHVVMRFVREGRRVRVVDGLLERTGGREEHLAAVRSEIEWIRKDIRDVENVASLLRDAEVVVDCMAWTAHHLALSDPLYDLALNAASHLSYLPHLRDWTGRVILLGSRVQYGRPAVRSITEETPMAPLDVQGVHKLAAESYARIYAALGTAGVVSLVIPNCYGPHQPVAGDDIGLIGSFIRDLMAGKRIAIYGKDRKRQILYVEDLAEAVYRISLEPYCGFHRYNFGGHQLTIEALARTLQDIVDPGDDLIDAEEETPQSVSMMDAAPAPLDDGKLSQWIGPLPATDHRLALGRTVDYFRETVRKASA